jgi:O-antigen/teichoic acid export membrane protein
MIRVTSAFFLVALTLPLLAFVSGGINPAQNMLIIGSFTVPATMIGAPIFRILRRHGQLTALNCTLIGAALGFVCAVPFALTEAPLLAFVVPAFSAIGALHGLLFWFLAVSRNHDLTSARPASDRGQAGTP